MTIGEKIKNHRKACGLTQKQLAELTGTTQSTIANYENGNRQPALELLFQFQNIFRDDFLSDAMGLKDHAQQINSSAWDQILTGLCLDNGYIYETGHEINGSQLVRLSNIADDNLSFYVPVAEINELVNRFSDHINIDIVKLIQRYADEKNKTS